MWRGGLTGVTGIPLLPRATAPVNTRPPEHPTPGFCNRPLLAPGQSPDSSPSFIFSVPLGGRPPPTRTLIDIQVPGLRVTKTNGPLPCAGDTSFNPLSKCMESVFSLAPILQTWKLRHGRADGQGQYSSQGLWEGVGEVFSERKVWDHAQPCLTGQAVTSPGVRTLCGSPDGHLDP